MSKNNFTQLISILPGFFACLVLFLWRRFFRKQIYRSAGNDLKRVLIVKLDAIGDFVLWLDVAKELRTIYPPHIYRIVLLGNQSWTDLAKAVMYFDEVWPIDRTLFFRRPKHCLKMLDKLLDTHFDVVLHPVLSREFLFGDLFVHASNSKQRIGMQGDTTNLSRWQKYLGDRCYTDLVSAATENAGELERNAQLLRWLGITDFTSGIPDIRELSVLPPMQLPADYYVVIPGASVSSRVWPSANFSALIDKIYKQTGLTAVVCGGTAEKDIGRFIERGTSVPLVNLITHTSLLELVATISKAHFLVGNETGAVHLAAALRVPSVCILGGGHFGRFIPYSQNSENIRQLVTPVFHKMECFGCNWRCIYNSDHGTAACCVEKITLDSVFFAINGTIRSVSDKDTQCGK